VACQATGDGCCNARVRRCGLTDNVLSKRRISGNKLPCSGGSCQCPCARRWGWMVARDRGSAGRGVAVQDWTKYPLFNYYFTWFFTSELSWKKGLIALLCGESVWLKKWLRKALHASCTRLFHAAALSFYKVFIKQETRSSTRYTTSVLTWA